MERGRRKKIRYIQKMPIISQFSPRGKPGRPDEIELKIDEYESFKLADFQGYNQSEGALAMGISRASFGRILRSARKIVADALVNGKIIRIRIADVQVGVRQKNFPSKGSGEGLSLSMNNKFNSLAQEEHIRDKILKYPQTKRRKRSTNSK